MAVLLFADEWRSHEDTVEFLNLLSTNVDQAELPELENDGGSASSDSEQLDGECQASDNSDDDDDKVSYTALSSRNPFELLADDSWVILITLFSANLQNLCNVLKTNDNIYYLFCVFLYYLWQHIDAFTVLKFDIYLFCFTFLSVTV